MRSTFLLTIGALFILQACSPEPVYRLKAEADDRQTSYYKGVKYIHLQNDSVLVTINYYEHTSSLFALDVEVINNSEQIVRVAPDSFAYKSYKGQSPDDLTKFLTMEWAKNPEQKILNLDLALARQKANQKTDELLFYTLQGLTVAGGVMAETEKEQEEASEQLVQNAVNREIDRAEYRYDRASLRGSKEFWKAEALRITDLWPGESIRGLVYFKTDPDAKLYEILIQLDKFHYKTWFRQEKYKRGSKHYQ
jgi:hypothetical protein